MRIPSREKLSDDERRAQAEVREATARLRVAIDAFQGKIKERAKGVKAAEKEGRRLISSADKALASASRHALVAYAGKIRVFEHEVQTPQGTRPLDEQVKFSVESAGNMSVTRRLTLTRAAMLGPWSIFAPKATRHDVRELYFIAEHPEWSAVTPVNPDAGVGARQAAAAANVAARNASANRTARQAATEAARRRTQEAKSKAESLTREAESELARASGSFTGVRELVEDLEARLADCHDQTSRVARQGFKAVEEALALAPNPAQLAALPQQRQLPPGDSNSPGSQSRDRDDQPGRQQRRDEVDQTAFTDAPAEPTQASPVESQSMNATVVLMHPGKQKIEVIKALRSRTGWGLREAKQFVDTAPSRLAGLEAPFAETIAEELAFAGATVELEHLVDSGSEHLDPVEARSEQGGSAGAGDDLIGQLERLSALRTSRAIDEGEFQALKARLLAGDR